MNASMGDNPQRMPPRRADTKHDASILVVEDEDHLAAGLKLNFGLEGYIVTVVKSAREAGQAILESTPFDVIVLDVMLPDTTGFLFCETLRKSGNFTPVIMLTARSAAEDRVRGLEAGADDYLVKPFDLDELLARVRSILRRVDWRLHQDVEQNQLLQFANVELDQLSYECRRDKELVPLTRLEFELVSYFIKNPRRVISRKELLENVWKLGGSESTRTVDNFVSRIRRHFENDSQKPKHFVSVRGAGYKFVP